MDGPSVQPPGTVAAPMQPQENAPEPNLVPLSDEAERAKRLLFLKAMRGDRAGVAGMQDLLKAEPTYQAQQKFATGMGEQAAVLAGKQAAGTRVYSAVNELEQKARAWYDHAPKAFNAATGPYNSNHTVQNFTGTLPMIGNKGGYDFYTLMDHDIDKLTALYREMPSSGKSAGSDAQDATFKEAMGAARRASSPEAFFAIMQSAKQLVRDKAGLAHDYDIPHRPLDKRDIETINKYAPPDKKIGPDSPYVVGALKRGEIRDGYRYKGGHPSERESWEKVQ
jgi:hypothetical protein